MLKIDISRCYWRQLNFFKFYSNCKFKVSAILMDPEFEPIRDYICSLRGT